MAKSGMSNPAFLSVSPFPEFIDFMGSLPREKCCVRFSDFELMDIYRLAPMIVLMDMENTSGRFKIRFVGTDVVQMYGKDNTGRYLDELDLGPDETDVLAVYDELVVRRQPHWTRDMIVKKKRPLDGREFFAYERLSYPLLREASDQVGHILALLVERPVEQVDEVLNWGPLIEPGKPE